MEGRVGADHASAEDGGTMSAVVIRSRAVAAAIAAATVPSTSGAVRAADARRATAACAGAEFREFDFFVGEWDVYDVGSSKLKAHNSVSRMLDGCAVREVYRRLDGYTGESFSTYDASRRRWHQSWVTNQGELLLLDGGMKDGAMMLAGPEQPTNGTASTIRGVWKREANGSVRETAERTTDGGA
ncbi:MAG TPA: hypothetical protein VGI97_08115, partial [Gemmatimonadaceae bacterium]